MGKYNPASLAYLGDAVFELLVREKYLAQYNVKSAGLHGRAVKIVNAGMQARMAEGLIGKLTEDEAAVYKRGRNTYTNSKPKNASHAEYSMATGLEALFGHLHVNGRKDRIDELFGYCMEIADTRGNS